MRDKALRIKELIAHLGIINGKFADASSLTKESFAESNNTLYIINKRQKTENQSSCRGCDGCVRCVGRKIKVCCDCGTPWKLSTKTNL